MDEPAFGIDTRRIEALGDGVFAIAMTLLILEIRVPVVHGDAAGGELFRAIAGLWPKFMCYFISFATLGVYWVAHHLHFATIKRADRVLMWINILFLLVVCLVPFSTALIGEYVRQPLPTILYGLNMIAASLVLQLHWSYATRGNRLVNPDTDPRLVRAVTHVILMGPVVYLVAIGLAFIHTGLSIALYMLVNLLYILPGSVHLHLRAPARSGNKA